MANVLIVDDDVEGCRPLPIDITVGAGQTQAAVMDWRTGSPVALPMLPLQD